MRSDEEELFKALIINCKGRVPLFKFFLLLVVLVGLLAGTAKFVYATVEVQKLLPAILIVVPGTLPTLPGDVDANGIVDINDLKLIASNFGQKPPAYGLADINNDGIVDIFDLVRIGINYGKSD